MAGPNKRAWKLQEFVAHSANVNCLALGHKSGHVLATGGDDKKVNLWAVGKSNCIMSLSGHTTGVGCVRFGHTENQVCGGSVAGALKIWDLEAARILRTLTGHKAAVRAIEFHPYGDFITSGSADTSVKLWDIRRKGCIFTYKGHTLGVGSLQFSPDGRWIASGGDEGQVKIWDLRMGRLLSQLAEHTAPVSCVQFHPHEFLLATSARDSTVNFWDLEQFSLVSSTQPHPPHSRCLHFSSGGECLYAAGTDVLKTHLWEPARTISTVHIPWGKIHDIATSSSKLVGASFHQMNVSLWLVDTNQLVDESSPVHSPPFTHGTSLRKSFNKQKPTPEAKKSLTVKTIEESERSETDPEDETLADIPNVHDYRAVFQPNRTLTRSPPPPLSISPPLPVRIESPPSSVLVQEDQFHHQDTVVAPQVVLVTQEEQRLEVRRRSISPHDMEPREPGRRHSTSREDTDFPIKLSSIHHSASETCIPRSNLPQRSLSKHSLKATSQSSLGSKTVVRETKSDRGPSRGGIAPPVTPLPPPQEDLIIPMSTDRPSGLDLDDFLPKSYVGRGLPGSVTDMSESEVLSSLMRGHESIMAVIESRNRNLQIVYSLWHSKDLKTAIEAAVNMSDNSVIVDFLGIITNRPFHLWDSKRNHCTLFRAILKWTDHSNLKYAPFCGVWNLDICVVILPAIYDLLQSKYESYMRVGCEALRLIIRNFSSVIKNNVLSGSPTIGVDIPREERYGKCVRCHRVLVSIRSFLLKRQTLQGALGQSFRELHVALQAIDLPSS